MFTPKFIHRHTHILPVYRSRKTAGAVWHHHNDFRV